MIATFILSVRLKSVDRVDKSNFVRSHNPLLHLSFVLSEWISFSSRVIGASNNITEMEKAIKYNTLVTNIVILQNVIDMSRIIQQLRVEGWSIHPEDLARLSSYLTEYLKRFGDFILDLEKNDGNIDKIRGKPLFS